jgi:hypothetical protein
LHLPPANAPDAVPGFDLTAAVRCVCVDMVARLPELGHIDLSRVAFSFRQTRKASRWGVQATLTPLRFEGGQLHAVRRGRRYGVQRVTDRHGQEMLYVLCVYLPRFMDHSLREKLVTLVHELWHISPEFNGDLRRHAGRCYAHSASQQAYDSSMSVLVDRWLAAGPDPNIYRFLDLNFRELRQRHGEIYGVRLPQPKLIPLAEAG